MPYNFAINQSQKDRLFADIAIDTDKIVVPQIMVDNWQQTLDLLSELVDTPAALIMRVHQTDIEVFTSSRTQGNPYKKHDKDSLGHGLYCEIVIKGGKELHIPNALKDKDWDKNPDIKLGMIAYCGLPLRWPDNSAFGTICMLDNKEHNYSQSFRSLLARFQNGIEANLVTLYQQAKLQLHNQELEQKVQQRTHELAELSGKLIKEIENRTSTETSLEYHKSYDPLTGLPNRINLINSLSTMLEEVNRKEKISVLYLGLRNFKSINDSYGYLIGDKILTILSQRLQHYADENTFIARIAGAEFVIIQAHKPSNNETNKLINKVLSCCNTPFGVADFVITIPSSMGIAQAPIDGIDAAILLQKAGAAMTISKADGSTHSFFNQDTQAALNLRYQLESHLVDALNKNELSLHYQPFINLETQKVIGAEALLRWHNPILGNVAPDRFIALAERNGQIIDIGNFVLHTALAQAAKWCRELDQEFKIAINISPLQMRNPRFSEHIADLLTLYQLPPTALELEITEGMLMQDEHIAHNAIQKLQELGIRISLDDFGTGYSSLSYLQKYSFDTLKIDRCFINKLEENEQDRELTKAIIAIGKKLNLVVIAEGVETLEQDAFIRHEECDLGQGYLYGKPITAHEFEQAFIHKKEH
ncbi:bifunctional diguanylate cyclase/phosphodiesterase [Shewanella baltica]|uniref:bifunctional diguanylate cyclase/phosphodiesterase n=1 Tax=Shewanella baltica TaxID=62322 RepID=UPI000D1B5AF7|nr:GGDEF domain-containing protein [Shewanella baltica]AVT47072.1 diguanylate cyclase [Shewanella baltica]